jgi:phosphohistidine phosphatase SixA
MPSNHVVLFLVAVLGLGCARSAGRTASTDPGPTSEASEASIVVFVRHAEKETDGSPDPPLTEIGRARAACLATVLETFAPTVLLATELSRTQATLDPLARAVGRTVDILGATDIDAWEHRLRTLPPGTRAVVSGHSNTIPRIVRALGGDPGPLDAKGNIDDAEYDRLTFVVLPPPRSPPTTFMHRYCVVSTPAGP